MLSIRLKAEIEALLVERARREGVTKSRLVHELLARELSAQEVRHPLEVLDELTANLPGSGRSDNSQDIGRRLKRKLRAKHHS
jgi:hypothetical protein